MTDREKGVKEAQEKRGIVPDDTLRFEVKNNFSAAYTCIRDNIEAFRRADGLFAPTDVMALAALRAFADVGVQVPRDIRVVGYDDIEIDQLGAANFDDNSSTEGRDCPACNRSIVRASERRRRRC